MILYDINKTCMDTALANIMAVFRSILNIIHIIGPIICLISLIIVFTKMMMNPDDKKLIKSIRITLIALVVLFFIPYITNVVMVMLDDSFNFSRCWNYSERVSFSGGSSYISLNNKEAKKFYTDPSEYEKGDEKKTDSDGTTKYTGTGLGAVKRISISYNVKDSKGRCGKGRGDKCAEVATVEYENRTVVYYMGYQNNSGLEGGSCRAHAFTCGMNAVNNTYYSTLDLQNYMVSLDGKRVFKGKKKYNSAINHFGVNAKAYFEETSIKQSYVLAKQALANGQPVMIFVAHDKCSDLAGSHHALLLLGYDNSGNVIFLDSCSRYRSAKKRNLEQLILGCMSGDGIAHNWMRMVIFSF